MPGFFIIVLASANWLKMNEASPQMFLLMKCAFSLDQEVSWEGEKSPGKQE